MPPKKKESNDFLYALIWFVSTRERFVVETSKLPKTRRKKGNVVKIIWEDANTQISKRYEVKILEFGNDKSKLENILLDEDGNVCDEHTKVFFRSVLDKKRQLQMEAKKDTTTSKIQKNSLAHKIAQQKPLFGFNTNVFSNQQASTSKSIDIFQQQEVYAQRVECNDLSPVQCSPSLSGDQELNCFRIDVPELSQSNAKNTESIEVNRCQNSKASDENAVLSTIGDEEFIFNEDKENIDSLEISVQNELDIEALHTFLPVTTSEENKKFLKVIYAGLSKAYEYQKININENIKGFKISGQNKKEISPNSGIFFPASTIETIEKNALTETGVIDWKKIVKEALNEIYGDTLCKYCAIGRNKNSLRPSIDSNIYNGIFDWILLKSTEKVTRSDYTHEITKIISNKRNSKLLPNNSTDTISQDDLHFFQKIISAVEKEDKWQQDSEYRLSLMNLKSRNDFLTPGPTKARISDDHNIFFPKSTIAYIEKRTENSVSSNLSDWKKLVKEALIEVYGDKISNYCAKGTRSSRSPIHPQLYNAIYAWANSRSETVIDEGDFINHINKIASNKRKTKKCTLTSATTVTSNQDFDKTGSLISSSPKCQQEFPPNVNQQLTEPWITSPSGPEHWVPPFNHPVNPYSTTTREQDLKTTQVCMTSPYQDSNPYYSCQQLSPYMPQYYNYDNSTQDINESNKVFTNL